MSVMRFDRALQALIVTRGHPFARDPFFSMFEGMEGIAWNEAASPQGNRLQSAFGQELENEAAAQTKQLGTLFWREKNCVFHR